MYSKFGDNGVGLQSALDVGVKACNYICMPRSCIPRISYSNNTVIPNIDDGAAGICIVFDNYGAYTYKNNIGGPKKGEG